jgi:hypothetical protein
VPTTLQRRIRSEVRLSAGTANSSTSFGAPGAAPHAFYRSPAHGLVASRQELDRCVTTHVTGPVEVRGRAGSTSGVAFYLEGVMPLHFTLGLTPT